MTAKKQRKSRGVRQRLGRQVEDADKELSMFLTSADIKRAEKKRRSYDVDDPENFTACALAECFGKIAGAQVMVMRRYAYVALPDSGVTLRYQLDRITAEVVQKNDLNEFGAINANTPVSFRPPTPGRRLITQGGPRVSKQSRGLLANPPRPARGRSYEGVDPYQGVYRNGLHAPHNGGD